MDVTPKVMGLDIAKDVFTAVEHDGHEAFERAAA